MSNSLSGFLTRAWEAEHKDETKPRFGAGHYRRGLLGQPKQIKTLLGQGDVANLSVENISETLRINGNGDTLAENGQEALDNYFDMRQGEAEAIQDYINREDLMSLSLQNSTKIALDEKMSGSWHIRTSAFAGIRIVTERSIGLCFEDGNQTDNRFETERGSSR